MKVFAGPCQIENQDHAEMMAGRIASIGFRLDLDITFKASFDKANRTSGTSPRGAGVAVAVAAFRKIRKNTGLRIVTDVHERHHCEDFADVVDVLQIPALLCRQTDLIEAAARTGRELNIKKGQFLAPADMKHAVMKARMVGGDVVYATERGTTFGFHDLVVDMRGIAEMKRSSSADAVIFDCTHSVQAPGSLDGATGGDRSMTETLARAAIAAGADGLFLECHDDPANALSDGPVMMQVDKVYDFLARMRDLHAFVGGL